MANAAQRVTLLFLAATIASACATPRDSGGGRYGSSQDPPFLDNSTDELRQAERLIEQGRYYEAIPPLQQAILKNPESESGVAGRYLLGVTYSEIANYRDAIDMLEDYLSVAPEGRYAGEARDQLARLRNQYDRLYLSPDEIDREVAELESAVDAAPDSTEKRLKLADAYWRRGNFAAAGEIYAELVDEQPRLATHQTIANRMEFHGGGRYVILTPQELERREIERRPLAITNEHSFKSHRDTFTGVPRVYVVTGHVTNRSDSVLYGVEVTCTTYGFGNVVFETNTAAIGRMYPGETRAYSLRFTNFRNIENIQRSECHPSFR